MKKKEVHYSSAPIPVRLEAKQEELITGFQARTGLGKSFIIRCCIMFAMSKFSEGEVDILTLENRK